MAAHSERDSAGLAVGSPRAIKMNEPANDTSRGAKRHQVDARPEHATPDPAVSAVGAQRTTRRELRQHPAEKRSPSRLRKIEEVIEAGILDDRRPIRRDLEAYLRSPDLQGVSPIIRDYLLDQLYRKTEVRRGRPRSSFSVRDTENMREVYRLLAKRVEARKRAGEKDAYQLSLADMAKDRRTSPSTLARLLALYRDLRISRSLLKKVKVGIT